MARQDRFLVKLAPHVQERLEEYAARHGINRNAALALAVSHGLRVMETGPRLVAALDAENRPRK